MDDEFDRYVLDNELNPYVGLPVQSGSNNVFIGDLPTEDPAVGVDAGSPSEGSSPETGVGNPGEEAERGSQGGSGGTGNILPEDADAIRGLIKKMLVNPDGSINLAGLAGMGGLMALLNRGTGGSQPVGYQGTIPKYAAVRERVPIAADPNRRPGAGGRRYFSDTAYVPQAAGATESNAAAVNAVRELAKQQAAGLKQSPYAAPLASTGGVSTLTANTAQQQSSQPKLGLPALPQYDTQGKVLERAGPPAPTKENTESISDLMARVRAANPQLDWSKYNPAKMTMDVDNYQQAINHYRRYGTGMPKSPEINLPTYGAALPPGYKWGPLDEVIPDSINTPEQYQEWRKYQGVDVQSTPPPPIASNQPIPIGISQNIPAELVVPAAQGGLMNLAKGRYLNGATDGMADKIPANIEGSQPAALSHGEFVVPADVVSHLGNGNSEAGAQRLYDMMDRIRKARTGTTKQGKQINPDKFMPK